ncbi:hypothetical protein H9Q08_08225 [Chryseobacterium sp. PS-8]|uniref:Uncharacterized protein n=1 Tax=Chryseobacterium indicum TaxID=2766954 RepID=A0ABS9C3Z7_9FLAO|nr:hypothetical protein [Chryseobacterium sp. PS-8]MCF2219289.1 hypothetical protein [Chryseobacterium sp. PS-8]
MRKIFILLLITDLIISCNNPNNKVITKTDLKVDSSKIRMNEAKALLDNVNTWMEKGIKKSISKKKVNEEINPLMEKYQDILKKMNKEDSTEIQNYRLRKVNELIDLQMQQN